MSEIITHESSFEDRAAMIIYHVFGGEHHVYSLKKYPTHWSFLVYAPLSTWDSMGLTRLVWASHEYAIRVEIGNGGPQRLKILVHPRTRDGAWHECHPSLDAAIEHIQKRPRP